MYWALVTVHAKRTGSATGSNLNLQCVFLLEPHNQRMWQCLDNWPSWRQRCEVAAGSKNHFRDFC